VSQTSLLIDAVRALESAGVGYMLTGSLASSLQGEPRSTHDVDLVIEVDVRVVEALAAAFGTDAYCFDGIAAIDALGRGGTFNLIDTIGGDQIDFWALTDEPFDQSRFSRRVMCPVFGFEVAVSAPEDTILQKLRWSSSLGGSERQLRDAVGVYQVQRGALDEGYLETWSKALEIVEALADVRRLAAE
jgi:hypothetical protein